MESTDEREEMMSNVRALPGVAVPPPVNAEVLSIVAEIYEMAKKGQIDYFACTFLTPEGEVKTSHAGDANPYEAIGMIEDLKLMVREELFE